MGLAAIVGVGNVLQGDAIEPRYLLPSSQKVIARAGFAVRPGSPDEVARVVRLAAAHRIPIVPLGGGTGLVEGAVATEGAIILSLERLSRIVEVDVPARTMTVEAGATLQSVQERAEASGLLMPLDLAARGSCTIGGNIATNAGGMRVIRWGMMRDMVLGLEVVLPDGTVVSSLTKAIKDNAGYRWKDLMVGSEGTLGIITRAVLRLREAPTTAQTAVVALRDFEAATELLNLMHAELSGRLSTYELMWSDFYEHVTQVQAPKRPRPLPAGAPFYVLIEALGNDPAGDAQPFENALARALERGLASDAVIAGSERERRNLFALRDDLAEAWTALGSRVVFDVSMALNDMPGFVEDADMKIRSKYPDARILHYGHMGDGNLHLVVSIGNSGLQIEDDVNTAVFAAVRKVGGSISAEHGVGTKRLRYLGWTRSEPEIALMRILKAAIDPANLMNPGKVVPMEAAKT